MKETLAAIAEGRLQPVYLVHGDRVLAEPAAARLADALGRKLDSSPLVLRRPESIADTVADLRTYSLFDSGKVVLVVESGLFADKAAAGTLFDDVRAQLPFEGGADDLTAKAREAALRLLQILRLFDVRPVAGNAAAALRELPASVFEGKSGRAAKAKGAVDELKKQLVPLLEAALAAGLQGIGESDASLVADLLRDGLPERHVLVLAESAIADGHPLARVLKDRGARIEVGELALDRGGQFSGLSELAAEVARESGVGIERDALDALAHRTLRAEDWRKASFGGGAVDARSTARFAAEYRKLASLQGGSGKIGRRLVEENVEDRGEENTFGIVDAIAAGKSAEALSRIARKIQGAEDPVLERLGMFSQIATLCRRVAAVRGIAELLHVPMNERNYKSFELKLHRELTGSIEGMAENPLKGVNAYPLFKAYQCAARLPAAAIARLPELLLETERRLKGDSGEPDAALAECVLAVTRPAGSSARP